MEYRHELTRRDTAQTGNSVEGQHKRVREWMAEEAHVIRWLDTHSPSIYMNPSFSIYRMYACKIALSE